jgi:Hydrazine synthase alpha subunit middle domain/WD40-like Beta Propeller Repeat
VNRSMENAKRITFIGRVSGLVACAALFVAGCTQGPGGGGIGIGNGQDPDPATVDFPIFYVRHQVPEESDDVTRVRPFVEDDLYDASLWKRDRASPGSPETNLTARLKTMAGASVDDRYDIKDLAVSPDGLKVAFAMRGPLDDIDDEDEPPTWNIWEYDIATDALRRVISSDIVEEEGQDVSPAYLPDGRILFSSTRQRQAKAILLDEGKAQFEASNESRNESTFALHVMNADGTDIHQITYNSASDLYGTVLQNGRILFTRWDSSRDGLHLYSTNPDGTDTQLYYGAASHDTGTVVAGETTNVEFLRPREMSDGRIMVLTRQREDVDFGGALTLINGNAYVENTQPLLTNAGGMGPAQTPATLNDVRTVPGPSTGGRFSSGFPLWDGSGRLLVSWSQCRLLDVTGADPTRIIRCEANSPDDPAAVTAPPLYSIWMFQPSQNTILPVMPPVEGVVVTEAVAAQPRVPLPAVILDKQPPLDLDADMVAEGSGLLDIRSVYDIMGVEQARTNNGTATSIAAVSNPTTAQYPQRLARFVRIEKPVSIPDDDDIADPDNSAFGPSGRMREIVAYAPIEPDGSVRMKIPANIAFQISLLDVDGRRVSPPHRSWLSVRPGEVLSCNGCHTRSATAPLSHGRKGLFNSVYAGSTATGAAFPGTVNTISPEAGDTMARARSRAGSSCIDPVTMVEHCGLQSVTPSANVVYNEIWTPAAPPTASFAYSYQMLTTASPANVNCFPVWTPTCRITIHYVTIGTRPGQIHPLWSVPRPAAGVDDGTGNLIYPQTCTYCHSRVNPMDAAMPQLPAASLELTDEVSDEDALQLRAYRQLLFPRNELELDAMGAVQVRLVPGPLDENGNPTTVPVTLNASMQQSNARGSGAFFNRFRPGGSHADYLTTAELRLLSEWLDIGAQYYNDPFPPTPQN